MDYIELVKLEKEVATAVALGGITAEGKQLIANYRAVRERHEARLAGSPEAVVPNEVWVAFVPVWEMFRESYGDEDKASPPEMPA